MSSMCLAIITYNRIDISRDVIRYTLKIATKHMINLYVFDNGSTDGTGRFLLELSKSNENLRCRVASKNIGYDRNVVRALMGVVEDYVWLLGDSAFISEDSLVAILGMAKVKSDSLIVVNNYERVIGVPCGTYLDARAFIKKHGWHMTLVDSVVWPTKFVKPEHMVKYLDTSLVQLGLLLFLAGKVEGVVWLSNSGVANTNTNKISFWQSRPYEIWCLDFSVIARDPPKGWSSNEVFKVIREHNEYSGAFRLKKIIGYRLSGKIYMALFLRDIFIFWRCLGIKSFVNTLIICLFPMKLLGFVVGLRKILLGDTNG